MSDLDREVLFANERFVIGVLQVVSGGSLVAALSQAEALRNLAGQVALLVFLTLMAVSLCLAIFAAYAKHEYKKWHVKGQGNKANSWLIVMRESIRLSLVVIIAAFGWLLWSAWTNIPSPAPSP